MSATPPPTYAELAREVLLHRMKDYSEDYHCASWLVDLEFLLWEMPAADDESRVAQIHTKTVTELRTLAEIAGGWWVYEDETQPAEHGPVFIPMDRWQKILESRKSS
mgnify:CR=1 FL=1